MHRPFLVATAIFCTIAESTLAASAGLNRNVTAHAASASASAVSIVDIGGFGGAGGPSVATAVSNGLVVGDAETTGVKAEPNAISTRGAGLTNIGAGFEGTIASAVNASGVAAGQVFFAGQSQQRAMIFSGGRELNIGTLPGDIASYATGINAQGAVVGTSIAKPGGSFVSQAFVYQNGKMSGLAPLRALPKFAGATAQGINDSGVIVGSVGYLTAFLPGTASYALSGSTLTVFAVNHGAGNSVATAINASGLIAGYHSLFAFSNNAPLHAYLYALSSGTFTDLGTLYPQDEFANSIANAINSAGAVVGYSLASNGQPYPHATVFYKGAVADLNTLLPKNSGWILETATGIDDLGNIVGFGLHNTVERGFILRTGSRYTAQ